MESVECPKTGAPPHQSPSLLYHQGARKRRCAPLLTLNALTSRSATHWTEENGEARLMSDSDMGEWCAYEG